MNVDEYEIFIRPGAKFVLGPITVKDGAGSPVPNAGHTARMHVRRERSDTSELLMEANTTNGFIVLGGANGKITVSVPATVTEQVNKSGWWDLLLIPPTGEADADFILGGPATRVPVVTE